MLKRLIVIFLGATLPSVATGTERYPFQRLVDHSTRIPGDNANFEEFRGAAWMDNGIAFTGGQKRKKQFRGAAGIYVRDETGVIKIVADVNKTIPRRREKFTGIRHPVCVGNQVFFLGGAEQHEGIYRFDGTGLSVVAAHGMAAPGIPGIDLGGPRKVPLKTVTFAGFDPPVASPQGIAFMALLSDFLPSAVFVDNSMVGGAAMRKVVSAGTPLPFGNGTRRPGLLFPTDLNASSILIRSPEALYISRGGEFSVVADPTMTVPGKPLPPAVDGVGAISE